MFINLFNQLAQSSLVQHLVKNISSIAETKGSVIGIAGMILLSVSGEKLGLEEPVFSTGTEVSSNSNIITNLLAEVSVDTISPGQSDEFCYRILFRNASVTEHSHGAYIEVTLPPGVEAASLPGIGGNVKSVSKSGDPSTGVYVRVDLVSSGQSYLEAGSSGVINICGQWTCVEENATQSPAIGSKINFINPLIFKDDVSSYTAVDPDSIIVAGFKTCPPPPTYTSTFKKKQKEGYLYANPGGSFDWEIKPESPVSDQMEYIENVPEGLDVYNFYTNRKGWQGWTISCDCGNGYIPIYEPDGTKNRWISEWVHAQSGKTTFPNLLGSDELTDTGCDAIYDAERDIYRIEGLQSLKWTTPDTGFYGDNVSNQIRIYTIIDENTEVGSTINNCAEAFNLTLASSFGTSCEEITIVDQPLARFLKTTKINFGTDYVNVLDGYTKGMDDIVFENKITYHNVNGYSHTGFTISDTLEKGLTYLSSGTNPNWYAVTFSNNFKSLPDPLNPKKQPGCLNPIFSKEYLEDGRTVLKWEFPACTLPKGYTNQSTTNLKLYYSARYDRTIALPLSNYYTYAAADFGEPLWESKSNGKLVNTSFDWENFTLGNPDAFSAAGAVESRKWVKGAEDTGYSRYPNIGSTNTNGEGEYQILVSNLSNEALTRIDVVDILPSEGDLSLLSSQSRGSAWSTELAQDLKVEILDNTSNSWVEVPNSEFPFGVRYANVESPCYLDANGSLRADMDVANFPAGCTDFGTNTLASGATAFSLRWENTTDPLQFGQSLRITAYVRQVGGEADADTAEVAWNSFGYTVTQENGGDLLSSEPIKVGLQMINTANTAKILDYVYYDNNSNGLKDENEAGVEGITVSLYTENGDTVKTAGTPYTRLTDSAGAFAFVGLDSNTNYVTALNESQDFVTSGPLTGYSLPSSTEASYDGDQYEIDQTTGEGGSTEASSTGFGFVQLANIGNLVWVDSNKDGIQDGGEAGYPGIKVFLYRESGSLVDSTLTDANGIYAFTDQDPGNYYLKFSNLPTDTVFTFKGAGDSYALDSDAKSDGTTDVFSVQAPDNNYVYMDAGLIPNPTNPASIQGMVWDELGTSNGVYDTGESILSGFTVNLLDANQNLLASIETDSIGAYEFAGLDPTLDYYVQFTKPSSAISFANAGADMDADQNGLTNLIALEASEILTGIDAGIQGLFSIGNLVWADGNGNGMYDTGETGMSGISIYLKNTTGTYLDTTLSDANGKYVFKELNPGSYIVELAIPSGYKSTADIGSSSNPNQADMDDNGIGEVVSGLVVSNTIVLDAAAGSSSDANHNEPDHGELINGESDVTSNPKAYYTVDFGFQTLPLTETNCSNGIDDDGDGLIDCDDPDCQLSVSSGSNEQISAGNSVNLAASVSGGDGDYSYTWTPSTGLNSPGAATTLAAPTTSTTYSLSVSDGNGCTDSDELQITVYAEYIVTGGKTFGVCEGKPATLGVDVSGGLGEYTYSWSPSTGLSTDNVANPIASPSSTTTYTVIVTDFIGGADTVTVIADMVNNPSVDAGSDITIEAGQSANLTGTGSGGNGAYTYSWYPTTGLSASNIANPIATPTQTTSYRLTLTDGVGCTAKNDVKVTVSGTSAIPGAVSVGPNIWLDASEGTATSDNAVSAWTSRASGGGDAAQASTSRQPTLTPAGLNYRSVLKFDGVDDILLTADAHGAITTDYNFFTVIAKKDESKYETLLAYQKDNWGLLHSYGEGGGSNAYTVYSFAPNYWGWNRDGTHPISSQPQLLTARYSKSGGGIFYYADGAAKGSHNITPTLTHIPEGSRMVVGGRGVNGSISNFDSYYDGDMAEVIFFNGSISDAERQKVETYLAVKYGLSLSHDYIASDGTVVWDYVAMSDYGQDIFGIGKDVNSSLYQKQSISANEDAIVSISVGDLGATHDDNPNTIAEDITYLMVGNNNGNFNFNNLPIAGPVGYSALNRVWQVEETGDIGSITIHFSCSNFNGTNYSLIIDTNRDGLFLDETPISSSGLVGNSIYFENIDLVDGEKFTLVENASMTSTDFSFVEASSTGLENDAENSWGASWVDYDGDGDMDLFVPDYAFWQSSRMYVNNGNGTFSNTDLGQPTGDKGSNIGAQWADFDNDGDPDLLAANGVQAPNRIYPNNGGSFSRIDNTPVSSYTGYNHCGQWVDFNNDGNLDIFAADYMPTRYNTLYMGDGLGSFEAITIPISREALPSMQGIWSDYDGDGLQDLFVANTWGNNNSMFHNDGNGEFTQITSGDIVSKGGSSISGSWGDYDNDGDMDLYVANTSGQQDFLYRNDGNGNFTSITGLAITNETMNSQGGVWLDIENDGDLDLVVVHDNNEPVSIFINNGIGSFNLETSDPLAQDSNTAGSVSTADYDNDGDLDVLISHIDNVADVLYANQSSSNGNNWKRFELEGTISNRSGLGAKVFVKATINGKSYWQMREVSSLSGGVCAQSSIKTHFGLGNASVIDSVKIEWPSGTVQYLTNVSVNSESTITEPTDAMIKVIAFVDANGNCSYDQDEILLPNVAVNIQKDTYVSVTDSAGVAIIGTTLGNHNIVIQEQLGFTHPCWTSVNITAEAPVDGVATTNSTYYAAFQAENSDPDVAVVLATTIMRRGMESNFSITYENDGVSTADDFELVVSFDSDVIPLSADIPWTRIDSSGAYIWEIGTLEPFETVTINLTDSISAEATLGRITNTVASFNNIPEDVNFGDNSDTELEPITAPVDPNDIMVSPEGNTDPRETLFYRIRFQNVGTFLAEKVVIKDTLPPGLDFESFEVMRSSHRNRTAVDKDGILTATFNFIMLPDSTTNEPESHGYLEFEIKPKKGVENGTIMLNKASIYFDAEEPIVTNTVANVILYSNDYDPYDEMEEMNQPGNEGTTSEEEPNKSANNQSSTQKEGGESAYMPVMKQAEDLFVIVAPNPVLDRADVRYQAPQYEKFTMRVLNSLGQTMHQEQVIALSGVTILELYTQNWTKGYYYIQMVNKTKSATFKFVKK